MVRFDTANKEHADILYGNLLYENKEELENLFHVLRWLDFTLCIAEGEVIAVPRLGGHSIGSDTLHLMLMAVRYMGLDSHWKAYFADRYRNRENQ